MSAEVRLDRLTDAQLREFMWLGGDLSYKFHAGQKELSELFRASKGLKYIARCSRRWGKSYWLCVEALMEVLKGKKGDKRYVRYAAPTAKMVRNIIEPLMDKIMEDCPKHLKPHHRRQEGVYIFPNGSEIHIAGCDNNGAEKLRGTDTHLGIVDEAGFILDLRTVVQDILLPQTITTGGRILMASTPGKTPAHPFHSYVKDAEALGCAIHRTIYQAPHVSKETIELYARETLGGKEGSTWKREYLAEFVVDEEYAVVPEFCPTENVLADWRGLPQYFDYYVGMDVGYSDLTVALLAYFDFKTAKIIVLDEVVKRHSTSAEIDAAVQAAEEITFPGRQPYRRVVDAPNIVVADIRSRADRSWLMARKDDKNAALNVLRMAIQERSVLIHPRCKTLISHLQHGCWNTGRTSYERSEQDFGHFDAIDAAVYLVRHVDKLANPYPTRDPKSREETHLMHDVMDDSVESMFLPAHRRG